MSEKLTAAARMIYLIFIVLRYFVIRCNGISLLLLFTFHFYGASLKALVQFLEDDEEGGNDEE